MKLVQKEHISIAIDQQTREFVASAPAFTTRMLASIEKTLNVAKTSMEDVPSSLQKERAVDLYSNLKRTITTTYNAPHVTNAWLKFWELYHQYPSLIPRSDPPRRLHVFFNAELPGSSLSSFYHFMKTTRQDQPFDWYASSLASDDTPKGDGSHNMTRDEAGGPQTAFGDTYGFYKHNREHWLMNAANNGDCTQLTNVEDFGRRLGPESRFGGVDFYAHDAGMDVSADYNNQELINARLHLGCALSGFVTMRVGASFVAKQYTFFAAITWSLILMYATLFDTFYIAKPLSSRPYNSEIYLIGIGYHGIAPELLEMLKMRLANFNTLPFLQMCTASVGVASIQHAADIIFNQQIAFINENIHLFRTYTAEELQRITYQIKQRLLKKWLRSYPIMRIRDEDRLPSNR